MSSINLTLAVLRLVPRLASGAPKAADNATFHSPDMIVVGSGTGWQDRKGLAPALRYSEIPSLYRPVSASIAATC